MLFHDGLSQQIAVETNAAGTVTTRYLVDAFGVPRGKLDIGNSTGRTYYMTDPRGNLSLPQANRAAHQRQARNRTGASQHQSAPN
ncbi:MAG: hypothetical protein WD178_00380 [Actinomycetota bacterium]